MPVKVCLVLDGTGGSPIAVPAWRSAETVVLLVGVYQVLAGSCSRAACSAI